MAVELWMISATMNFCTIPVIIYFMVAVTHGAGFHCRLAFIRLLQRVALFFLALACLQLGLHTAHTRHDPSVEGFMFHIAFTFVWVISMVRHLWAPAIPEDATRQHPVKIEARR